MARKARVREDATGGAHATTAYRERAQERDTSYAETEEDVAKMTTVEVTGRAACPPTLPDNVRYGRFRGVGEDGKAIHWPGEGHLTVRVPIAALDEIKDDPWIAASWNRAEEEMVRANTAPDVQAKSAALKAAELELAAAEANARAAQLTAQAAAIEAQKHLETQRQRLAQIKATGG
jgi:hypothetical protein